MRPLYPNPESSPAGRPDAAPVSAWCVRVAFGLVLVLTYLTVSAEGMRNLFEVAATPLHKTGLWPLTALGGYAETRRLDVAHLLSLAVLVVVWVSWELIVYYYAAELPLTNARRVVWAAGTVLLVCDAALFWLGVAQTTVFGGSYLAATLMTVLYVAMLVLVATFVNLLERRSS